MNKEDIAIQALQGRLREIFAIATRIRFIIGAGTLKDRDIVTHDAAKGAGARKSASSPRACVRPRAPRQLPLGSARITTHEGRPCRAAVLFGLRTSASADPVKSPLTTSAKASVSTEARVFAVAREGGLSTSVP